MKFGHELFMVIEPFCALVTIQSMSFLPLIKPIFLSIAPRAAAVVLSLSEIKSSYIRQAT